MEENVLQKISPEADTAVNKGQSIDRSVQVWLLIG
jgi:hypothetical protein